MELEEWNVAKGVEWAPKGLSSRFHKFLTAEVDAGYAGTLFCASFTN